ncbi:MAG TPA: neutral/alkaline non-lysosomal ceramidase N-terminal domain-containing protein [Candidatus Hydrogenedentes bacterium]|nr:neutral/alkaline non-lysosomal ceramidase N-terminal domain-containing protein [Candidatus Hydrogenedentota bacterium]
MSGRATGYREGKGVFFMLQVRRMQSFVLMLAVLTALPAVAQQPVSFKAGFAEVDISPQKPIPMWGYGDRHDMLSEGVRDPLFARALVIEAGADRLAIVGLDIGRGPTAWMMPRIREAVKAASGIDHVIIAGSHTHHGPVIELQDQPGKGKGRFDDAVAYASEFERKVIEVINAAAADMNDARIGWGSTTVDMNHNRHTKIEPKPVDRELSVLRVDDLEGKSMVVLVSFAAHPTNLPVEDRRFSSEYPGQMIAAVQEGMGCHGMFMQGACGDLSTKRSAETDSIEAYGKALGAQAIELAQAIETKVPDKPSIRVKEDDFVFQSRVPLDNPILRGVFQSAFFPEFISILDELSPDGTLHAPMTTVLMNGEVAIVTGPGEFFCNHAIRLKERCRAAHTFFFGYTNGHLAYFPTIEAAAEGGYGADAMMSWVELSAGEQMMDTALINIYSMMGKYPPLTPAMTTAASQ